MVLNTNGVDVSHRSTLAFASYNAMVDGSSPGEGVISFASPWLKDYDPARTGERLAQQALSCREAAPFEGRANGPVMISPWELEGMLSTSLCEAVRAESVTKRRSPWGQMEGQKVASDHLTIVDDPSDPRGLLSAAFDDEGVPTSVKTVVGKGCCALSFMTVTMPAYRQGPSGNGMRRQPLDAQYQFRGPLRCSHLNLVIRPGTRSLDEMVSSIDDGLVVERFAFPTVNAQTGAFSLEVRSAYLVRRGAPAGISSTPWSPGTSTTA
jgi:PmbA protein